MDSRDVNVIKLTRRQTKHRRTRTAWLCNASSA